MDDCLRELGFVPHVSIEFDIDRLIKKGAR